MLLRTHQDNCKYKSLAHWVQLKAYKKDEPGDHSVYFIYFNSFDKGNIFFYMRIA